MKNSLWVKIVLGMAVIALLVTAIISISRKIMPNEKCVTICVGGKVGLITPCEPLKRKKFKWTK